MVFNTQLMMGPTSEIHIPDCRRMATDATCFILHLLTALGVGAWGGSQISESQWHTLKAGASGARYRPEAVDLVLIQLIHNAISATAPMPPAPLGGLAPPRMRLRLRAWCCLVSERGSVQSYSCVCGPWLRGPGWPSPRPRRRGHGPWRVARMRMGG